MWETVIRNQVKFLQVAISKTFTYFHKISRLASSLLQSTPKSEASEASKASEEIQTSIKEVTSAIVHYVSGLEPANGDIDRQPSPRSSQKLYWLESSFVGKQHFM